jgi:hypothetical protein
MEKLERAHGLLLKGSSTKNRVEVLEAALDALLDKKDPIRKAERSQKRLAKKDACTGAVESRPSPKKSRYIPAAIKHVVYKSQLHRCSYVSKDGKQCEEVHNLQIDHKKMWCFGGGHEVPNLRLLCPPHNRFLAGEALGHEFIEAFS